MRPEARENLLNQIDIQIRSITGSPEEVAAAAEDRLAFRITRQREKVETNRNHVQQAMHELELAQLEGQATKPLLDTAKVKNLFVLDQESGGAGTYVSRLREILTALDSIETSEPDDSIYIKRDILGIFATPSQAAYVADDKIAQGNLVDIFGTDWDKPRLTDGFTASANGVNLRKLIETLAHDTREAGWDRDQRLKAERRAAAAAEAGGPSTPEA